MFIIMLGAPGTGKGTVGKLLSENLNLVHISTGDIFRSHIKNQDEIGKELDKYISKGDLVPDELTIRMLKERLEEPDAKDGAILDGFPRTKKQAIVLDEIFSENGKKIDIAIELDLSDEDIIERISKRRICANSKCKETYNLDFKPPQKENICDKCGSELTIRDDDNEEVVRNRLKNYHELADELIEFYKEKEILYSVKLSNKSDKNSFDVAKELEEYLK